MQLIIDIPDNEYKQNRYYYDSVYHGTPLDDVRAKINAKELVETTSERAFYNMALEDVLQILDNIGKAEREDE